MDALILDDVRLTSDVVVRSVLKRIPDEDLAETVERWGLVGDPSILERSAARIVSYACKQAETSGGLTLDQASEASLLAAYRKPSARVWRTLELTPREKSSLRFTDDADALVRTLRDELYGIGLRHNTYAQIFDNTLWIHIGVYDSRPSRHDNSEPAQAVVLVYFPLSRYVLFAGPKGAYEWTTAVLSATFNAQECAESKLTGRNIRSLEDILLFRGSQGKFAQLRKANKERNPLDMSRHTVKRVKSSAERAADDGVALENGAARDQRKAAAVEAFGDEDVEPPRLEELKYNVEGPFRGLSALSTINPFRMEVTFRGPAVLSGVRQLLPSGIAEAPLCPHLANITSLAVNEMTIVDS